ncbi:hypothetical protein DKP78_23905, partial [Enterococcus faecium]
RLWLSTEPAGYDDEDDDLSGSPGGTIHGDRGGRQKTFVKNASPTGSLKWNFDTIRLVPEAKADHQVQQTQQPQPQQQQPKA